MENGRISEKDHEPVSPAGRFFLRPEMDCMIYCIVAFEKPVSVPSIKAEFQRTFLHYYPRLKCLQERDAKGREIWRPSPTFNIDDHVIVVGDEEDGGGGEIVVEDYVASFAVSSPLGREKPLWEIHVIPSQRTVLFRLHHSLSDGTALMSLFLASCERADDPSRPITLPGGLRRDEGKPSVLKLLWMLLKVVFFTVLFVLDFLLHASWVKDEPNPISGGAGVELWPRKLCSVTFQMDDIKAVKNKMNATINDVMLGIITSGLAKYFKIMSPKDKRNKFRITGLSMVDIRRTPGIQDFFSKIKDGTAEWGNRFGYVILPLCFDRSISNSLEYVKQAKAILGQKKQSLEAKFTYHGGSLIMSFLGLKLASKLNYRVVCNTSFSFSNVVGPSEMIMFAKNPILSLRVTTTTLPHAFISHFISYNGKASMQLMVTKDIIHDPEILAKCFCDSLNEMKSSCDTQ